MNPLACTKCAGRLLMALAAMTSILLIASCGSGGSPARGNSNGFSDSDLKGTYVFSSAGSDANGYPLALAGTLSANGSGSITGGTIDIVTADPSITPASPVAQAITGSYNVNTDGRGQATLTSTAYGTFVLDFVLTSTSHGLVTEYDSNGTGSGTIDLQTAVTSLSQLAGSYAFSFAGADSGYNSFATAGAFTLNSSGVIAAGAGVEDFNDGGVPELDQSLTSNTAILGTGTGPGTITLTTESHALTYDFYPIDTTHIKFIETDYAEFLSGDAFTQSGASSIPTGTMVFTMAGGTSAGPIADGGTMTSTGDGNFTGGLEDINNAGTVVTQVPFSGIGSAGGSIGGRVITNLTGFDPNLDDSAQWVIYPFAGGLLMLESDSVNVTLGTGYVQSATSFTAPAGYGLNLAGENTYNGGSEVDDIAQFNATTAATNNMSGILDENVGGAEDSGSLSGTYTPGSPNSITATASNTYLGGLTLAYYVVDSSSVIFVDIDPVSTTDLGQVAVGTFEAQSTPGGGAAVHSHMAIVHPAVRPHGAWRRK